MTRAELFVISIGVAVFGLLNSRTAVATHIFEEPHIAVDAELLILIDISGSIDAIEMATQLQGWGEAFIELGAEGIFTSGPQSRVAVNIVWFNDSAGLYWGYFDTDQWFLIDSAASAAEFGAPLAEAVAGGPAGGGEGSTAPGTAINFAYPLFESNIYDAGRQVINVSGDGIENSGDDTATARDAALAAGVDQINGLYILGDPSESPDVLKNFYETEIRGGSGAFVSGVQTGHTDLDLFKQAIKQHTAFALNPDVYNPPPDATFVPEPSTLVLTGSAVFVVLGGLGRRRCQQRRSFNRVAGNTPT